MLNFLLILVVALAAQEWARLVGYSNQILIFAYIIITLSTIFIIYNYFFTGETKTREFMQPLLGISSVWWTIAFFWIKNYPESAVIWSNYVIKSLMGFFVIVPLWFSVFFIFNLNYGRYLLVLFVLLVALTDIGGYLVGKKIGRHPLIPSVSPKKTWEGFFGGMGLTIIVISSIWILVPPHYKYYSFLYLMLISVLTVLASVVGDLTVSMLKREVGREDTGRLLPGHGGLLDRCDGIFAAAPIFTLCTFFA